MGVGKALGMGVDVGVDVGVGAGCDRGLCWLSLEFVCSWDMVSCGFEVFYKVSHIFLSRSGRYGGRGRGVRGVGALIFDS